MLRRLHIYLKEMYPIMPRIFATIGLFFTIYFFVIAIHNVQLQALGITEFIGSITVFGFLMALRIVDEFKDYETDKINFPNRPLPSGRVKKSDLITLLSFDILTLIALNLFFVPNFAYFAVLLIYGFLMSFWFFNKKLIQPNLVLALVTHNPIQIILVFYVLSLVSYRYSFEVFSLSNLLVALIMYIPGLAWEISRKIRSPKSENQYTTYSKLFGYKKPTIFVLCILLIQLVCVIFLMWRINALVAIALCIVYAILVFKTIKFIGKPSSLVFGDLARMYIYCSQTLIFTASIIYVASRLIQT